MKRITESDSLYDRLEEKRVAEILTDINRENKKVALTVEQCLSSIEPLVNTCVSKLTEGGRLFYIGAGTSGRLGVLDASECPPTFGVGFDMVIGLIAGGDTAIRKAVEHAEDDQEAAWSDLEAYNINAMDVVVGVAASGTTPYVLGGLRSARAHGIVTGCITCNPGAPIIAYSDFPIVAEVGPEYITGSTRMKSGTAQKMILNMITTATMIRLGRVKGNKMVDMQLTNDKLKERAVNLVSNALNISKVKAWDLLEKYGSVRKAIEQKDAE